MESRKLKTKTELLQMTREESLKEFLDMDNNLFDTMAEVLHFCSDMYVTVKNGTDSISVKTVVLYFKQTYLLLEHYKKIFEMYGAVVNVTKEQYKGIMSDIKAFKKRLRRSKKKILCQLLLSRIKIIALGEL